MWICVCVRPNQPTTCVYWLGFGYRTRAPTHLEPVVCQHCCTAQASDASTNHDNVKRLASWRQHVTDCAGAHSAAAAGGGCGGPAAGAHTASVGPADAVAECQGSGALRSWLATAPDPDLACGQQLTSSKGRGSMLAGAEQSHGHARLFRCFVLLLESHKASGVFLLRMKINIRMTGGYAVICKRRMLIYLDLFLTADCF